MTEARNSNQPSDIRVAVRELAASGLGEQDIAVRLQLHLHVVRRLLASTDDEAAARCAEAWRSA